MSHPTPLLLSLALVSSPAFAVPAPQGPAQGGPPFVSVPNVDKPLGLFDLGGRLFLAEDQPATGNEPWTSTYPDGPSFLLGDLNPGPLPGCHSGDPEAVYSVDLGAIEFGSRVLFSTHEGVGGQGEGDLLNLWISDGTVAGTQLLRTFDKPGSTYNYGYTIGGVSIGESVVFNAYTDADGWGVWRTDGTPGGTEPLRRLDSAPYAFHRLGNTALFAGSDLFSNRQLWRTDGTPGNTKPLKQVLLDSSYGGPPVLYQGELYFAGTELGVNNTELWKSDGTTAGTVRVKDIQAGLEKSLPQELTVVGEHLYFSADDGLFGREIWMTDGTEAGTVRVTDLNPGLTDGNPEGLTELEGSLIFHAPVQSHSRVYRYEDAAGLLELGEFEGYDYSPFYGPSDRIYSMTAFGSRRVLFSAQDDSGVGRELWVTDGTPVGTQLYADLEPGSYYGNPEGITLANGQLFVTGAGPFVSNTLLAAPGGGTADPIGLPCAASGELPLLDATDPVLGSSTDLQVRDGQPGAAVLVFRGAPAPATELGFGCTTYLDVGTLSLLATGTLDAAGAFDLTNLPIPADPALNGVRTTLQVAVGPAATAPLGLDLSNAVLMTLGY